MAVGVAIGISAFYVAEAIVAGLLVPIVAIFVGDPEFDLNAFTISGTQFRYGVAIEYVLSFLIVLALGYLVLSRRWDEGEAEGPDSLRRCPECTMSIPSEATRCPFCTARIGAEVEPTPR